MAPDTFGIALVGTGFGQKVHLPAIQDSAKGEVVAIYHRDLGTAQAIAAQHNIPHASHSLEQLLGRPEVQGVSLSTPPFLHYEMARKTLNAKKHLFLEKPITLNANEAKALQTLAAHQDLTVAVNFEFRFVPAWMQLKRMLEQNYVGVLRLIKVDWLVPGRADPQRPWSWHASNALGGGSLGALGSHAFDYIAWLFGPIKRLQAKLLTTIPERPDPVTNQPKLIDADDTCTLMLELESGTVCQLSISATTYAARGHWVEVYGDRGTLILGSNNPQDYVHGFELSGSQYGGELTPLPIHPSFEFPKTHPDGRIAPVTRVFEAWIEAAQNHQPLTPGIKEGVASQIMMDAARLSDRERRAIDIPLD
jgi:predicted dehydrogenase